MNNLNEQISRMREMMGYQKVIAAGVVPYSESTKTFLVGLRSADVDSSNTGAGFGGGVDSGEDLEEAVMRELEEEIGYYGSMRLIKGYVYQEPKFEYHNFIGLVSDEFEPHLNWENDDYQWLTYRELLWIPNKHMGLVKFMDRSKDIFERLA
jgi:8-oxo-dGTP pyrophosphatase MutT (NUDIX family)